LRMKKMLFEVRFLIHIRSIPNCLTRKDKIKKLKAVIPMQVNSEGQNPINLNINGKAKNIGRVGITYQKVYQA